MTSPAPPTLFLLPFLGGSGGSWAAVRTALGGAVRCVPVDLPGFGDAAAVGGYDVAAMAAHVAAAVRAAAPRGTWFLAGHSMGAKVAAVLARRVADGTEGLRCGPEGLSGLVLLAGSPPAPEPMPESKRREMLGWFKGQEADQVAQAEKYIGDNLAAEPPDGLRARMVQDVLRMDRAAWVAWLEGGSREDWADRVGVLPLRALVLAGSEDEALGEDAQRKLVTRHYSGVQVVVLRGCGHLLPAEAPDEVAALVAGFTGAAPAVDPRYAALIDSDRVDAPLRDALWQRAAPDDPGYAPRAMDAAGLEVLRAVAALVLPGTGVDWGARLDALLAEGGGDGWRFADLPPDAEACRAAMRSLDTLAGGTFAALDDAAGQRLLERVAAGQAEGAELDAGQLAHWFKDLCGTLARQYVAHPATLARMGYSGIGTGGTAHEGFAALGTGERDAWEPAGKRS